MKNYAGLGLAVSLFVTIPALVRAQADTLDWPMYNHDVLGIRHNPGEKIISKANAGQLVEKWRFPAKASGELVGVIHATPIVVDGYVYFGTATDPAFYKLTPDGKVRWSYRRVKRPEPAKGAAKPPRPSKTQGVPPDDDAAVRTRFQTSPDGIFASALVTEDSVFFCDIGGWTYALDRATGAERWKLNSRVAPFPGAHMLNCFFASPILADGKVIVAGGAIEQVVNAFPGYRGCNGRGFVMALEPKTGKIVWKYDVGPKPEPLDPPIVIKDSWGSHTFYYGPSTSTVWSTPSYDADTGTIFFGTDTNNSPRRPTADDPRSYTRESCAIIALNVRDGKERWLTQINPGDIWTMGMCGYDQGRYKDQSIGDTPKIYTITASSLSPPGERGRGEGAETSMKVVGAGCKNGGFYVLKADDGQIVTQTPVFTGPPKYPLSPEPAKRMITLPGIMGGLQTGCATDGKTIFTNGTDCLRLGTQEKQADSAPPSAGRVVALSTDTNSEFWRHERPRIASIGGPAPKPVFTNVGDPVASGIAVANGVIYFTTVASGKLMALDAGNGTVLKEIDLGPVWSGPSVSRGRVYVGTGNTLFNPQDWEAFFPKKYTGTLYSFGLPGEDEVSRLGSGKE